MRSAAVLVTTCAVALLALPAEAVRPVCRIVQDARGDAGYPPGRHLVPGDAGDDLLSADVAGDGRSFTAVWRLAELRVPNPAAPLGQQLLVTFTAKGTNRSLYLLAGSRPEGPAFTYGYVEREDDPPRTRPLGTGKGVLDVVRDEVRMTVPATVFRRVGAHLGTGTRVRDLLVASRRVVVPASASVPDVDVEVLTFDSADGPAYVVGTPSCARPVR